MRRISKIRNRDEATMETQREDLRDRRWARHKSKILTLAGTLSMILASGRAESIIKWVEGI